MKTYVKGSNKPQLIFMSAILVVIIVLMIVTNKMQRPVISDPFSKIDGLCGVIGHKYYNKLFRFSISSPDINNWDFEYMAQLDSAFLLNTNEHNCKTVVQLVRMDQRDTLAVVNFYLFPRSNEISAEKLSSDDLKYLISRYQTQSEPVAVVGDVTPVNSLYLNGAFFVIELPSQALKKYPVWVTMFMVRNDMAYKVVCQSRRDKYENLKSEFEYILKNFQLL